jgi:hypothetical protein
MAQAAFQSLDSRAPARSPQGVVMTALFDAKAPSLLISRTLSVLCG